MDDRDRRLLASLRCDARQPIVALARQLNLSRSATQERLARLIASGVIRGFTTIEGEERGARHLAYFSIALTPPGYRCAEVAPKLKRIPGVVLIHSVTGETDLIVQAEGDSVADIERVRSAVAALPGVNTVTTSIVLERHLG